MTCPYQSRIAELHHHSQQENLPWNPDSESDFQSFVTANPGCDKALIGLVNNGNLRATWKATDGSHLGLQFLGDGNAEFVIFKPRPGSSRVSRVTGIATLPDLPPQIKAFDLGRLVCSPATPT